MGSSWNGAKKGDNEKPLKNRKSIGGCKKEFAKCCLIGWDGWPEDALQNGSTGWPFLTGIEVLNFSSTDLEGSTH